MENQITLSKRKFLIGLGSLGTTTLLNSCADIGGLENLGLGSGLMPTLLIKPHMMMSKLAPNFPYQKSYQGLASATFSNPIITPIPDAEKIRVGLTTQGGITGGTQLGGTCQLACGLRYDPDSRGIFLKDSTVEDLTLTGINTQLTSGIRDIANLVGKNILERYPVYTIPNQTGLNFLKKMNVTNDGILLSFGI